MPCAGAFRRATKEDDVLSLDQTAAGGTAAHRSVLGMTDDAPALTSEALLDIILASLDDDKAEDVVQVSLRGKSEMADYMVICSGRSSRQVSAISDRLVDKLKQDHGRLSKVEGKDTGDWVLIDTGDVVIHVFRPEVREFYQLEKMWVGPNSAAQADR
ncbi:ribosome silencing factor [Profundibacterium mesophilum]|nr:ribosome silencing factor [Profundibacterium mesophilum]